MFIFPTMCRIQTEFIDFYSYFVEAEMSRRSGEKNIDRVLAPQGLKVGTNKLEGRGAVCFTAVLK